jgi:hypothetical protein
MAGNMAASGLPQEVTEGLKHERRYAASLFEGNGWQESKEGRGMRIIDRKGTVA